MKASTWVCGLAVWALIAVPEATAGKLIFEPASGSFGDFGFLPQGYGNRITSVIQDGFKYSLDGGATPNVVTKYGAPNGMVNLFTWAEDYGDLHHVVFAQEPIPFELRLVADPGFLVTLNSFDMAGWPHLDFPSIASVSVRDGAGNSLFSQSDVFIHGAASGPQHTHFAFSGVTASELRITFDSTTNGHGTVLDSDDVGIDNINFSQSAASAVPEPASLTLLGLGVLALSGFTLKRGRRPCGNRPEERAIRPYPWADQLRRRAEVLFASS
jgi:hypothetical protein